MSWSTKLGTFASQPTIEIATNYWERTLYRSEREPNARHLCLARYGRVLSQEWEISRWRGHGEGDIRGAFTLSKLVLFVIGSPAQFRNRFRSLSNVNLSGSQNASKNAAAAAEKTE